MIRQYNAQRHRVVTLIAANMVRHARVGTIAVGTLFRHNGLTHIVEAWHTREYTAHHVDAHGHWQSVRMLGGHLASVRRLHDGTVMQMTDWYIKRCLGED